MVIWVLKLTCNLKVFHYLKSIGPSPKAFHFPLEFPAIVLKAMKNYHSSAFNPLPDNPDF